MFWEYVAEFALILVVSVLAFVGSVHYMEQGAMPCEVTQRLAVPVYRVKRISPRPALQNVNWHFTPIAHRWFATDYLWVDEASEIPVVPASRTCNACKAAEFEAADVIHRNTDRLLNRMLAYPEGRAC